MSTNGLKTKKLPKSVIVGPYTLAIKYVDNPAQHMLKPPLESESVHGCIRFDELTIYVAKGQPELMMADTILHEMNHCVWAVVGGWASDLDEELIVSMMTTMQLDTLRRNKTLAKFVTGL